MSYIIPEFEVLLKHSTGGTIGSHRKPQDITASNTSNNENEHLPNTSLNQLQNVPTMVRYNYSTSLLTDFFTSLLTIFKGPVPEIFLEEKTSMECTFIPNAFPRNYLNKNR
jgi:hypothetical protein